MYICQKSEHAVERLDDYLCLGHVVPTSDFVQDAKGYGDWKRQVVILKQCEEEKEDIVIEIFKTRVLKEPIYCFPRFFYDFTFACLM